MSKEEKRQELDEKLLKESGYTVDSDEVSPHKAGDKKKNSYQASNIFSKLTFWWVYPFIRMGNNKFLEQTDHDPLREQDKTKHLYSNFKSQWDLHKQSSKWPIYRACMSSQKWLITKCFFLQFIVASMDLVKPIVIGAIIKYSGQKGDRDVGEGILLILAMIMSTTFQSFVSFHSDFNFNILGYNLNNSVILSIFEKSLNVSLMSNKDYKAGQIINIVQVDALKLYTICQQIASMIFLPIQLVVGLYLIWTYVGISFVGGLIVIFLMGIINFFITKYSVKYQKVLMKDKDQRMKITNEVFGQIKFIKVNAWEEYFYDRIDEKREKEVNTLKTKIYIQLLSIFVFWLTSPSILNAVFAWYTLSGNELSAGVAFPVISLFNSLSGPIQQIPSMITQLIETHISMKRIQNYMKTEEIQTNFITQDPFPSDKEEYAITIQNGTFTWGKPLEDKDNKKPKEIKPKEEEKKDGEKRQSRSISFVVDEVPLDRSKSQELNTMIQQEEETEKQDLKILKELNINIKKNQMAAIVGDVGCGKSSFLYSLIGEMKVDNKNLPKIQINGKLSLVNQKPWVLSDTIKNNIVFGQPYNEQKYQETIQYAQLTHDFEVLTNGDQTMIGEKGVNLSGGQKARVSLARAIYSDSDILLLDDVLSAVDIHVGKAIVKECLMKYKKNTTRLLVTHALSYMKYMDYIYLMDNGVVIAQGNYEDIKQHENFQNIYDKFMKEQYEKEHEEEELKNPPVLGKKLSSKQQEELKEEQFKKELEKVHKQEEEKQKRKLSSGSNKSLEKERLLDQEEKDKLEEKKRDKIDDLIMAEDRQKGQLGFKIYWKFIEYNGGIPFLVAVLLASIISAGSRVLQSLWIEFWTEDTDQHKKDPENQTYTSNFYLLIFTVLSFGISISAVIRATVVFLQIFKTSIKLHKGMVSTLLYAPLNEFFDRVPLGRILNRLSKDLTVLDTTISFSLASFLASIFYMLGTVFLLVYSSTPWVLIPIVLYLVICMKIYQFYMNAQREVVRLESITKSPVVSYFSETLNGLHTVRAYQRQQDFIEKQCDNIDENKKNQIMTLATNIWFRMFLSLFAVFINLTSVSYNVFGQSQNAENQSKTGLLLTYAVGLDFIIRWMVMMLGWFEQRLISFERCIGFLEIDNEPGYTEYIKKLQEFKVQKKEMPVNEALTDWPDQGVIEFKDTWVRYRSNLDPVIRGLSFSVNKEEKIGIVGRTGAGKSTITLCLLRVLELMQGQIFIDNIDISKLSLEELRSKITIILQDPQLFEGSLRSNVDPLHERSDEDIKQTLVQCNLNKFLEEREGLETQISEGGGNLSVGEKQLICIARALLKKSKVVLIDEATANIDIQTEHMVQETIKKVFKDCTVLTIAHRINTILESDRILVLSNGKLEEFEEPKKLLQNPNSLFYKLHEEALKENNI